LREQIREDKLIGLNDTQRKTLETELNKDEDKLNRLIKEYYRTLYIPEKNGPTEYPLGIYVNLYDDHRNIARAYNTLYVAKS
jgi:hypothetical protein